MKDNSMHKFISFLLALLLAFFVLPTAQARSHHYKKHSPVCAATPVTEYLTTLTNHSPRNLAASYSTISHTVSITAVVKDYNDYTAKSVALEFYTFDAAAHVFKAVKPADVFDLTGFSGTQDAAHLALAPITSSTGTQAAFVFPLLGSVVVHLPGHPVHLLIVESATYVPTGGGTVLPKGPVFTTLLLEPTGYVMLSRRHLPLKRVR